MTTWVIDTSVVVSYLLDDEVATPEVMDILHAFNTFQVVLVAPPLMKSEVANALRNSVVRKRITPEEAQKLLDVFLTLQIKYEEPQLGKALHIALTYGLSFYDACYLTLALTHEVELLTLDTKLKKVWKKLSTS